MKKKGFVPYFIYFITMLLVQLLLIYVAPFLLLFVYALFPVFALILAVIVGIVGNALQRSLGYTTRIERLMISGIGSLLVVGVIPISMSLKIAITQKSLNFTFFYYKEWWITVGIHFLIMYIAMEVTSWLYDGEEEELIEKEKSYLLPVVCCGILVALVAILAGGFMYQTEYAKSKVTESISSMGDYKLTIMQIGSPGFPFGPAKCQAVLTEKGKEIQKYEFLVNNDGANAEEDDFAIEWDTESTEIISSGEEQLDQQITMHFDGQVESRWIEEERKEEVIDSYVSENVTEISNSPEVDVAAETIEKGYRAIYNKFLAEKEYDFIESYSAKGNSRYILKEDKEKVLFLVYDRPSKNENCELYVLYQSIKLSDGSWSASEAQILDIYAYEIITEKVIASGKTAWSDVGSKEYQAVTGE